MALQQNDLELAAPDAFRFYRHIRELLQASGIPFLLGGAYAFAYYTGIVRHTKDLDLFVRPRDAEAILNVLASAGYRTEIMFSHWLGKAFHGDDFVDVIFNSGNGLCPVDDLWFDHAVEARVLGMVGKLIPAEEMIWQKSFIMERERFDGADVNHLLRARGRHLDWDRLLRRFGTRRPVLLAHLILFGFVYPDDRESIPPSVLSLLLEERSHLSTTTPTQRLCRGPLLSRTQYAIDCEEWGYTDARLRPIGPMTEDQAFDWTAAGR